VTRPPFSIVVLSRAQREIQAADRWWSEHRENPDASAMNFDVSANWSQYFRRSERSSLRPGCRRTEFSSRISNIMSTIVSDLARIVSKYSVSGMQAGKHVREYSARTAVPDDMVRSTNVPAMTPGRAVLVGLILKADAEALVNTVNCVHRCRLPVERSQAGVRGASDPARVGRPRRGWLASHRACSGAQAPLNRIRAPEFTGDLLVRTVF
jgi:hypothetical protein